MSVESSFQVNLTEFLCHTPAVLGHIDDAFVYKLKILHSDGECHNKVGVKRVVLVAKPVLWL